MAPAPKKCFCGSAQRNAEVQCSECRAFIHYECLGLDFKQLCTLLNQNPGIYLCKTCSPKTNATARKKLTTANKGCDVFEFNTSTFERMNAPETHPAPDITQLTQALESKFEALEKRFVDMVVKQDRSYAAVASKYPPPTNQGAVAENQSHSNGATRGPHRADPKRSLIVARLDQPKDFSQSSIKEKLISIKDDIAPMIFHARVLNSGKLLIEARSPELRDQLLQLPAASFGQHARIYPMDAPRQPGRPRGVITRGLRKGLNILDFETEVKREYASATEFSIIPGREGSNFCSVKFTLSSSEEFTRILAHGCFVDMLHLRVEPMVAGPRRCFNCQRYGHIAKVCRSRKRCANCGSFEHDHSDAQPCQAPSKCCNCGGAHETRNKECPSFKTQLAIIRSTAYNV